GGEAHEDYLECGLILYQDRRYEEAARAAAAALWLRPAYAPAHRLRAEAVLELAEQAAPGAARRRLYRDALRSFDRSLAHGRPRAEVYRGRALVQAGLGDFAAAVGEYTQALAVRPGDAALHAARGWAYLVLDVPGRARDDFAEAARLDPANGHARNGLG